MQGWNVGIGGTWQFAQSTSAAPMVGVVHARVGQKLLKYYIFKRFYDVPEQDIQAIFVQMMQFANQLLLYRPLSSLDIHISIQ